MKHSQYQYFCRRVLLEITKYLRLKKPHQNLIDKKYSSSYDFFAEFYLTRFCFVPLNHQHFFKDFFLLNFI